MSLEQNICVCHLLLKSSFVEKERKLLASLITLGLGYTIVGTVEKPVELTAGENTIVYLATNLNNSLQANCIKRD